MYFKNSKEKDVNLKISEDFIHGSKSHIFYRQTIDPRGPQISIETQTPIETIYEIFNCQQRKKICLTF